MSNSLKQAQVLRLVLQHCQCSSSSAALQVPGVLPCIPAAPTCQPHSNVLQYPHHNSRCNHTMAQAASSSGSSSKAKQPPQEQQQQHRGAIGVFRPNQLLDGGRYQLLRPTADLPTPIKGKQATLWQGRDMLHQRDVELQCLEAGDTGSYTAGMREAALHAASGRCDNIVPLLDAFEHRSSSGRHPVMVFEQTKDTLASVLQRYSSELRIGESNEPGALAQGIRRDPRALKALARNLLKGLDYLHKRGVVHMQVEPQNVVLDRPFKSHAQMGALQPSKVEDVKLRYLRYMVWWAEQMSGDQQKKSEALENFRQQWGSLLMEQAEREAIWMELSLPHANFRLKGLAQAVCLKGSLPYQPSGQPSGQVRGLLEQPPRLYSAAGAVVTGDPMYQPPEEILGMDCVAPSYDVWKLGCLLFEAATGLKLFDAELRQLFLRHRNTDYGFGDEHYILASMVRVIGHIPRGYARRSPRRAEFFYQSNDRADANVDMLALHAGPLAPNAAKDSPATLLRKHTELPITLEPATGTVVDQATAFADFLSEMLRWEPASRASPEKLLQHPWLSLV